MRVRLSQCRGVPFALLTACTLLLSVITARAGQNQGYDDQLWRVSDGLPNSQVRALAQSSDGLLWVGTLEGLATFDGLKFTTVEPRTLRQMSKQHYLALTIGPDGSVWFSNGHGLSRHYEGKIFYYSLSNGLPSTVILSLFCDKAGDIIAGTEKGARKFKDGLFVPLVQNDPIGEVPVRAILQDDQGCLWIGCSNGLVKIENDKLLRGAAEHGSFPRNSILTLAKGVNGAIWAGTSSGLTRIDPKGSTNYTMANGLLTNSVRAVYQARDGTVWIGSAAGLQRLDDGKLPFITQGNSFAVEYDWVRESVFSIFEDDEANIWIGSNHGLIRLKRDRFQVYSTHEGLPSRLVNTVMEDHSGRVWVGTASGIARIEDGRVLSGLTIAGDTKSFQVPRATVFSLLEDDQDNIWFGTRNGVYRMKDNSLVHYTAEKNDLSDNIVRCMVQAGPDSFWVGASNGLTRLDSEHFTNPASQFGLAFAGVRALAKGKDNHVWVGTEEGLFLVTKDSCKRFTSADGLSTDRINALYVDDQETVWIGTESSGLARFRNGRFSLITPAGSGLFTERIYSIIEDDHANLWMGSRRGIFRARKKDLNAFADGQARAVNCVVYGKDDGLRSVQCTGSSQPAAWKGRDGRLWFATVDGVAVIDAESMLLNRNPPKLALERIVIDGRPIPWKDEFHDGKDEFHESLNGKEFRDSQNNRRSLNERMTFPPGRGNVEFDYTGISLQAPDKVSFQYQLEGVDEDWVDAGHRRSATYANLPPGSYRFLIRAGNNDGFWTPAPVAYAFTLQPHFYQRASFYTGAIGLLALGLYGLYRARVRTHEQQAKELAALVAQRTEHLEAALKSMQAFTYSMAHDLRAPLRSIRLLTSLWIEEYRDRFDPKALNYAQRIESSVEKMQELMQDLMDYGLVAHASADTEKVSLRTTFDSIRLDLRSEVEATHAEIETNGEPGDVVANPVLLRQALLNLVTNALKFVPPQTHPHVRLRTERRTNCVRICVEDNGIGIQPRYRDRIFRLFERLDAGKKYPGTGVGLAIVQKAVERMGGKVGVESEPGKGSCFWVELPAA